MESKYEIIKNITIYLNNKVFLNISEQDYIRNRQVKYFEFNSDKRIVYFYGEDAKTIQEIYLPENSCCIINYLHEGDEFED